MLTWLKWSVDDVLIPVRFREDSWRHVRLWQAGSSHQLGVHQSRQRLAVHAAERDPL
jgi:hypothetical protein